MFTTREEENPKRVASIILNGGVIICPAFTIYGFSASLFDFYANHRIMKLKRRREDKPFIVIARRDFIMSVACKVDKEKLMRLLNLNFTVIVNTSLSLPPYVSLGGKTAFRLANTPFLDYICKKTPITSTSVNIAGSKSLNNPRELIKAFGSLIDGMVIGKIMGVPSTIVELDRNDIKVIRKGFNYEKLKEVFDG